MVKDERLKIMRAQLSLDEYKEYLEGEVMDELGYEDNNGDWVCTGFVNDKWDKKIFSKPVIGTKKGEWDDAIEKVCNEILESKTSNERVKRTARNTLARLKQNSKSDGVL